MKQVACILLLICLQNVLGNNHIGWRELFINSTKDESIANEFFKSTHNVNNNSAITLGYKAVSEFIMCNYTSNVYKKWSYFKNAKQLLETAIKNDPKNIELIFLRYSIQKKLPSFLGYNENLQNDENQIATFLNLYTLKNTTDPKLIVFLQNFYKLK